MTPTQAAVETESTQQDATNGNADSNRASRMKIAYLASQIPAYGETFVINEIEAHHQAGVDILALSCDRAREKVELSQTAREWENRSVRPPGPLGQLYCVAREFLCHPIAMSRNLVWLVGLLFSGVSEFLKGVKEFFTAACLAPACRKHGTQLIHVHFASRSLTAGVMLGRLIGAPVTCTVHAFELWLRSGRNLRYRLKHCAFLATESHYHVRYIQQKCGSDIADLCHVIHNGVDCSDFQDRQSTPIPGRIVLISRLTEQKGHKYLIDACAILRKREFPCECVLVGTGPDERKLHKQIKQLGLEDTVQMVGAVANDQLEPYLSSAAVFALPAVVTSNGGQDGIPLALVEAMACGVPVVSTDVAGIPELLDDGDAGCLVPQRDAGALADALQRVMTNDEQRRQYQAAGRRMIEAEFDVHKSAARLRQLFHATIRPDTVRNSPSTPVDVAPQEDATAPEEVPA